MSLRDEMISACVPYMRHHQAEEAADAILAKLQPRLDAVAAAALETAADMIAEYTTSQHVAHDIRVGIFPEQSAKREAMAGDIRVLANDPEALAAWRKSEGLEE